MDTARKMYLTQNPAFGNWQAFDNEEPTLNRAKGIKPEQSQVNTCWCCEESWMLPLTQPEKWDRCPICHWSVPKEITELYRVRTYKEKDGAYRRWESKPKHEDMW